METIALEEIQRRAITTYDVTPVVAEDKPAYCIVKRLFDVMAALLMLVILCVPMLIISILIPIDSPGPAVFKQERLGKDGEPFIIYKFRSMCLDAEKNGPQWADEADRRCTKVGRILRKTHLDELPQLINVLRGEMSLVGPRPERAYFYDEFESYIHGFRQRLQVTPGITGWAQVNGGYLLPPEEKIVYDMEYINNRSVKMDLKCIFRTVGVVLGCKGAR